MRARLSLVAILAAAAAGCSKAPPPIVPVTGVVTLDGKPLPFAIVKFYPQSDNLDAEYIGSAVTDKDGRYTLMTKGQPGGCACINKVTVDEAPPPDDARSPGKFEAYKKTLANRPIPKKYANTSGDHINITVTAGTSEYPIELARD
jgi:hypothetical protein